MAVLADQTALPWADELLRKIERAHKIGRMTVAPTVRGMFRTSKSSEVSLTARLERARQSGYADGGREAKLMLLALGKGFEQATLLVSSTP
jgi:hypothetical protein